MAAMQRLQAFKYTLMPTGEQQRAMRRFAGACRFVFNRALALQKENHEAGGKFIGYVAMAKRLTAWRHSVETAWLKDAPVHPLQHALKDLEKAYKNFFEKRAEFPRFKRKGQSERFRYPDPKQIKLDQANSSIFLPKLDGCATATAAKRWASYATSPLACVAASGASVSRRGARCPLHFRMAVRWASTWALAVRDTVGRHFLRTAQ